jgi:hypothetical protein
VLLETPGPIWVLGVGTTAAVVAFFFHGVVDYFLFATPIYVLFWFLMSICVSWPALAARAPEREGVNPA